jgi:hypothetical protein
MQPAREKGGRLHLFSLLSTARVHASIDHLGAVIGRAKEHGLRLVVHAMLDRLDTPARSSAPLAQALEAQLKGGVGRIGTVCGRMFGTALAGIEEACMFGAPKGFAEPFVVFDYPGVGPADAALHLGFTAPTLASFVQRLGHSALPDSRARAASRPSRGASPAPPPTMLPWACPRVSRVRPTKRAFRST